MPIWGAWHTLFIDDSGPLLEVMDSFWGWLTSIIYRHFRILSRQPAPAKKPPRRQKQSSYLNAIMTIILCRFFDNTTLIHYRKDATPYFALRHLRHYIARRHTFSPPRRLIQLQFQCHSFDNYFILILIFASFFGHYDLRMTLQHILAAFHFISSTLAMLLLLRIALIILPAFDATAFSARVSFSHSIKCCALYFASSMPMGSLIFFSAHDQVNSRITQYRIIFISFR